MYAYNTVAQTNTHTLTHETTDFINNRSKCINETTDVSRRSCDQTQWIRVICVGYKLGIIEEKRRRKKPHWKRSEKRQNNKMLNTIEVKIFVWDTNDLTNLDYRRQKTKNL